MSVKSPALKYYGSKFRLAAWIIGHFPKHRHYVEPFGGGASVLLLKQPSPLETYNDLDHSLVTFFRVLRDRPHELVAKLRLSPWSRSDFPINCSSELCDDLEKARRLYCRLWMSIEGGLAKGSFRRHKNGRRSVTRDFRFGSLYRIARRLRSVVIEERDANQLIREMDSADTLYYLDPPYLSSTRTASKVYSHEMTDGAHREFTDLIRSLKGQVVLSGYPSALYTNLLENKGWHRVDKRALANSGALRIESLWLSPNLKI